MSGKTNCQNKKEKIIYRNVGIHESIKDELLRYAKQKRMTLCGAAEVAIEKFLKEEKFLP